ncbi:peptidyl-prolyl cis-trans isomerase [bacterium]|nr:peptidyl-prolyl cis-trans isomerase [candidate division CSSED10-310 bacterium]
MRCIMAFLILAAAAGPAFSAGNPVVVMETSLGTIEIELDPGNAPITTKNFLTYTEEKFFDGTIFHRVIPDFMIQGGGFTPDMFEKSTHDPINNEAKNGIKNTRGTIAMARTPVVDSATAQFFINLKDNDFLNHRDDSPRGYGYAVFGHVVSGMDVVDKIAAVSTGKKDRYSDVPLETVMIKTIRVKEKAPETK